MQLYKKTNIRILINISTINGPITKATGNKDKSKSVKLFVSFKKVIYIF